MTVCLCAKQMSSKYKTYVAKLAEEEQLKNMAIFALSSPNLWLSMWIVGLECFGFLACGTGYSVFFWGRGSLYNYRGITLGMEMSANLGQSVKDFLPKELLCNPRMQIVLRHQSQPIFYFCQICQAVIQCKSTITLAIWLPKFLLGMVPNNSQSKGQHRVKDNGSVLIYPRTVNIS